MTSQTAESPAAQPKTPAALPDSQIAERLASLGVVLPPAPAPVAAYVPAVRSGRMAYTSGQLPFRQGVLAATGLVGDATGYVTAEDASECARLCAINALAALTTVTTGGVLDEVVRIVKVTGYVASAPGFTGQPAVIDGCSRLLVELFGEAGRHARSAVGVAALPLNAPVEIDLLVELRDGKAGVAAGSSASAGDQATASGAKLRMPDKLVERARRLVYEGDWEVPVPRDAATVLLVRDRGPAFEVFLQRRLRSMAFAAGMYVFPGGAVEESDRIRAQALTHLLGPNSPATINRAELDTYATRSAACRETREETGFMLYGMDDLVYIAHWITPTVESRRFDTRFYAVVVDDPTDSAAVLSEADESCWITPADALAGYGRGELAMLPPTVAVLSQFAEYAAAGLDAAAAIAEAGRQLVRPMLPTVRAEPTAPEGIAWVIVDARTGEVIVDLSAPPAGSEVAGATATS